MPLGRDGEDQGSFPRIVPHDTGMQLRPANPDDDDFVEHLFRLTRAEAFAAAQLPPGALDAMLDQQFRAQTAAYAAQFPGALSFVITRETRSVGRLLLHIDAYRWHIVDVAVIMEARNQGVGTNVILALTHGARTQGAEQLRLVVLASNAKAHRLYARLGFVDTDSAAGGTHIMMANRLDA
jgi:ribosomal protein S18 acetylase RimI-like enzyme